MSWLSAVGAAVVGLAALLLLRFIVFHFLGLLRISPDKKLGVWQRMPRRSPRVSALPTCCARSGGDGM